MHTFIKWPKIENLYSIEPYKLEFLNSLNTRWVVTEKIDGTNFSLSITEKDYKVGRRNDYLGDGASFYNIFNNIHQLDYLIKYTQEKIKNINNGIHVIQIKRIIYFGEYFGNKVLNRIYYGNDYQFRVFGCCIEYYNGYLKWLCIKDIIDILPICSNTKGLIVPVLGIYDSFNEACKYPTNLSTILYQDDKHKDEMEGVVIIPYNINPINEKNSYIIKNKNPNFLEKKIQSNKIQIDNTNLKNLREQFKQYCTESRMVSVFSKIGIPLNGISDAGIYIKEWLQDAYEDFIQENSLTDINKGDKKFISNVGSLGFEIFCSTLNKLNK